MASFAEKERAFLEAVSQLAYSNPFLPDRTRFEQAALGSRFVPGEPVWSLPVADPERPRANVWRIFEILQHMVERIRIRLINGSESAPGELELYEDAILQVLYQRNYHRFYDASFG